MDLQQTQEMFFSKLNTFFFFLTLTVHNITIHSETLALLQHSVPHKSTRLEVLARLNLDENPHHQSFRTSLLSAPMQS